MVGNTDELLFRPASLTDFAGQNLRHPIFTAIEEIAAATREALGAERLAWLQSLPRIHIDGPIALVHASPETRWRGPSETAIDADLESLFGPHKKPIAVYAHIHRSYIRRLPRMVVANTGSVSLCYDGD